MSDRCAAADRKISIRVACPFLLLYLHSSMPQYSNPVLNLCFTPHQPHSAYPGCPVSSLPKQTGASSCSQRNLCLSAAEANAKHDPLTPYYFQKNKEHGANVDAIREISSSVSYRSCVACQERRGDYATSRPTKKWQNVQNTGTALSVDRVVSVMRSSFKSRAPLAENRNFATFKPTGGDWELCLGSSR